MDLRLLLLFLVVVVPAGGGGSHGHPFSGTSQITTTFSDGVNMAVNYVDVIICTLN